MTTMQANCWLGIRMIKTRDMCCLVMWLSLMRNSRRKELRSLREKKATVKLSVIAKKTVCCMPCVAVWIEGQQQQLESVLSRSSLHTASPSALVALSWSLTLLHTLPQTNPCVGTTSLVLITQPLKRARLPGSPHWLLFPLLAHRKGKGPASPLLWMH